MTEKQLKKFFEERPQLTPFATANEAGIAPRLLAYILAEPPLRRLTERTTRKLLPVLEKYGYKERIKKPVKTKNN